MKILRYFCFFLLASLAVALLSAIFPMTVEAKVCYGPGNIVVPCPSYSNPTKAPPTATATATLAPTATAASALVPPPGNGQPGPGDGGQSPSGPDAPSGSGNGLGGPLLGGLLILAGFIVGLGVDNTIGRIRRNAGLNTADLKNILQKNISSHVPKNLGAGKGDLAGLNRALNRAGLPGLGDGGFGNDGTDNDPVKTDGQGNTAVGGIVQPSGEFPLGGFTMPAADGSIWFKYVMVENVGLLTVPVRFVSKTDPIPDDDNSGPGTLPLDGSGHVRPPGDVMDAENMPGPAADAHGNLNNLAKLNEHANLGGSSGPGTQHGGATDPSGDSDSDNSADAGDLKQIQSSYDATYDPSPEHPLSDSGQSAGKVNGP